MSLVQEIYGAFWGNYKKIHRGILKITAFYEKRRLPKIAHNHNLNKSRLISIKFITSYNLSIILSDSQKSKQSLHVFPS